MKAPACIITLLSLFVAGCSQREYTLGGPRQVEFRHSEHTKAAGLWLDGRRILDLKTSSNAEFIRIYDPADSNREAMVISIVDGELEFNRITYEGNSMRVITYDKRGEIDTRGARLEGGEIVIQDENGNTLRTLSEAHRNGGE